MIKLLIINVVIAAAIADPSLDQLPNFKKNHPCPIGTLTTANGAPVEINDTYTLNTPLLSNNHFMDTLAHLVRENIPERIFHPKGVAAFGYFVVTHNISDICKAKLFSEDRKITPVVVRFSQSIPEKGAPDTGIGPRGLAVKFYTEQGNFDIPAFHTPMFFYKDPMLVEPLSSVLRSNPVTGLKDSNNLWDFITLRPETMNTFLFLLGDQGVPDGYRHMPCFGIHTYQVCNQYGEIYFVRFHIIPDLGSKYLYTEDSRKMASLDSDYAARDLYNAIANGNFPSWTISVQVLDSKDIQECEFDPFDVTKILPEDKYPLRPVGTLVVDKNPTNHFADSELSAYCPGNLVPGISGAPDKVFESRRIAYVDTQRYRLGVNFNKIRVNCPFSNVWTYDRDGVPPVGYNGGEAPNYYPNSYNGPAPYVDKSCPRLITIKQYDDSYNFKQITERYTKMPTDERNRLVRNIVDLLGFLRRTEKRLQQKVLQLFKMIHPDLSLRTMVALSAPSDKMVANQK